VNPNDPAVQRGRKRLAALGIDPDSDLDEIQAFYERERARYLHLAENGLHFAPTHAIQGMLVDALKSAHGWSDLPEGWPSARIEWPTPEERQRGERGR
jgi:hypothetical protein